MSTQSGLHMNQTPERNGMHANQPAQAGLDMSITVKIAVTAFFLGVLLQGLYAAIKSASGHSSFPLALMFCVSQAVALSAMVVALWQLP